MATGLPPGIDPDVVRERLARFKLNREAVERQWEQLAVEHDGEWVASHEGALILAESLEAAIDAASDRDWPLDVVFVKHLSRERNVLL